MEAAFGGRAVEVGGVVVRPGFQTRRVGTLLVAEYVREVGAKLLTAHTRNPAILRLFAEVCGGEQNVYPLGGTPELAELAQQIPHATTGSGVTYHIDRYDEGGLYGHGDPADRPSGEFKSLKQRFPLLENERTALVVIGQTEGIQR
ncbi:MAG TPA: hypothetical protein VIM53_02060 [Candidatus Saccharimonadales bacterium]